MQINRIIKFPSTIVVFIVTLTIATVSCSTNPKATVALSQHTSTLTAPNSSEATVSFFLANANIKAGDNFTVDVLIDSKVALRGAQCALSFDPSLMKCDSAVEGTYFKDWADANGSSTLVVPQPTIDNTAGQVSDIGVAIMGTKEGGAEGNGVFCIYNFTALSDGVAKPTLSDVILADENGKTVPVTVSGN